MEGGSGAGNGGRRFRDIVGYKVGIADRQRRLTVVTMKIGSYPLFTATTFPYLYSYFEPDPGLSIEPGKNFL